MTCLRSCGELEEKPEIEALAQGVLGQGFPPGVHFGLQEKNVNVYRQFYLS